METFLSALNTDQFEELQKFAHHFLGNDPIEGVPPHHNKKVLPSSYQTIVDTTYPKTLNLHLANESRLHDDHTAESHKGGGIGSAVQAITGVAWEAIKHPPLVGDIPIIGDLVSKPFEGLQWLEDFILNPDHGRDLTTTDQQNADVMVEAYKDMDERAEKIHGWLRLPKYDSNYACVYYNPKNKAVYVGIRGSASVHDWVHHNTQVLSAQHAGAETVSVVRKYLMEISEAFPNHDLTVVGHSLSGTFLKDAFVEASDEDKTVLDNYDHITLINPGSSPLAEQDSPKEIMADPRTTMLLNKSDLISQGFTTVLQEVPNVDFVYGDASWNPLTAHGYSQFTSDDPEYDKQVEWGTGPLPDYTAPSKWVVQPENVSLYSDAP